MDCEQIIGILAGILTTVAVIPQIVKSIQTRNVNDVSPVMFLILCIGVGLWTCYGILKKDFPIIITNAISLLLNSIMLYLALNQNRA